MGPAGPAGPAGPQGPAGEPAATTIKTKHGELSLDQLAEIQPGLGTVMIEYSTRFRNTYEAAKADNWDLAKYQLKEALEIQEVGEATRPGRAEMLKSFEDSYLAPLGDAIDSKDWTAFEAAYNDAADGCNACHTANGYSYISYPDALGTTSTTNHGQLTLDQLAEIQPGLGTVMMEYSTRFHRVKEAATAGNWDLAAYQLKEALEIQEVGEATRPGRAAGLKAFEDSFLTPLGDAIDAKDSAAFDTAYSAALDGCNACHTANGFSFITYPDAAPEIAKLDSIWSIQPGLGTIMIEYGKRYYGLYYAAKAGNWDLAKYQLKEAREIQEVGETTRPGKATLLKNFEDTYLVPLADALDAEDFSAFETAYNEGVSGCNACHAATGHAYIEYALPATAPDLPKTTQ